MKDLLGRKVWIVDVVSKKTSISEIKFVDEDDNIYSEQNEHAMFPIHSDEDRKKLKEGGPVWIHQDEVLIVLI